MDTPVANALCSLEGLSVGDAFGERCFSTSRPSLVARELPSAPWPWTDDTHMALSIVEVLKDYGHIDQEALAQAFVRRFVQDPYRGYGMGTRILLSRLALGEDWHKVAPSLFGGGSYGNGAAMRAAPIGGFFGGDPARAATEAQLAAAITHAHPEGQAGAMAIAAAAAIVGYSPPPMGENFLREVLPFVPKSRTRERIELALDIPPNHYLEATRRLGTGRDTSSQDTVPFCLWCAAYHLDSFEESMWWTVRGGGDRDTTCAIVGGIVALSAPVPRAWVERREPLPPL